MSSCAVLHSNEYALSNLHEPPTVNSFSLSLFFPVNTDFSPLLHSSLSVSTLDIFYNPQVTWFTINLLAPNLLLNFLFPRHFFTSTPHFPLPKPSPSSSYNFVLPAVTSQVTTSFLPDMVPSMCSSTVKTKMYNKKLVEEKS